VARRNHGQIKAHHCQSQQELSQQALLQLQPQGTPPLPSCQLAGPELAVPPHGARDALREPVAAGAEPARVVVGASAREHGRVGVEHARPRLLTWRRQVHHFCWLVWPCGVEAAPRHAMYWCITEQVEHVQEAGVALHRTREGGGGAEQQASG